MEALVTSLPHTLNSLHGFSGKGLALLLGTVFRGTCLLLLCGGLVLALRRASAAARHLVWSLGLGAMLALPFISLALPAWDVPVITTWLSGPASKRNATKEDSPVFRSQINRDDTARVSPAAAATADHPFRAGWILSLWVIGSSLWAARMAVGEWRVLRIARRSLPFETPQAKAVLESVRSSFRLSRAVIGTSGQILSLSPFNDADAALTEAAMDAVRQWRYTPTLLNGEPVEVVTTVTVGFRLDE